MNNTELTITASGKTIDDQTLRERGGFTKKTKSKLIKATYEYNGQISNTKLTMQILVESEPFIAKAYIYIIGIVFGTVLLIGVIVVLYIFRSWFECIYSWPCCKSTFVKTKLPEVLKKFPEETYEPAKNKFNQENCAICLCCYGSDSTIRILECKHIFHGRCIVAWFTRKNNDICPICNVKPDNRV